MDEYFEFDSEEEYGEDYDYDEYEEYEEVEVDLSRFPAFPISLEEIQYGIFISDLLIKCGLMENESECRKFIEGGGVWVNEEEVPGIECILTEEDFWEGYITLEKYPDDGRFVVLDL